jgi:hypothetical protein
MSETAEWKIPALRMPSPEEHRQASLHWLERVQPTLIDLWPRDLAALSMPTTLVRVDASDFLDAIGEMHDAGQIAPYFRNLAHELDDKMGWQRKFVKLNSRSPKDWPFPFEIPATVSGKEAVLILSGSERIIDDAVQFKYVPEQPAYICLREFVHWMRGTNEFRCFVKDGRLIAVTHYDYTKPVPEDYTARGPEIRAAIDAYFAEKLKPVLHIDTVVFDLAMNWGGQLMLVEINPYGSSDPCWFGTYAAVENASESIQFAPPSIPTEKDKG